MISPSCPPADTRIVAWKRPTNVTKSVTKSDVSMFGSTLRLDDRRADHAGISMSGDVAIEGVNAGRTRPEECEEGAPRRSRNVNIQFVDVEVVPLAVAVLQLEGHGRAYIGPQLGSSNLFCADTSARSCASALALTLAVVPDGGITAPTLALSMNGANAESESRTACVWATLRCTLSCHEPIFLYSLYSARADRISGSRVADVAAAACTK
jgi:hypothetical protein